MMPHPATHPDIALWRAPSDADVDAILAVFRAADPVDHPSWVTPREEIADSFTLSHIDPARDLIVGETADGTIVAVGGSVLHPSREVDLRAFFSGVVHPDWRRRGIGTTVMRWQKERALEQIAEARTTDEIAALPGSIHVYVEERDAGATVVAESLGLETQRWFTNMLRDMKDPVPAREVAEGIRVATYERSMADATRIARNDAFRDHWGSLPTEPERWSKFVDGPFFRPDLSAVALEGDRVVAFCLASVNEDDWQALGASNSYIDLIGVVRDSRGKGLAPAVIAHALGQIAAAGLEKAVLDVDTASPTGANTLYERLGFTATDRHRVLVFTVPPAA